MALKFLNKKGWHTGSLRNIENVWKAEQKHDAEEKKLEELKKQIEEERERAEFRLLQERAGLVPRQERLDFLYESGLGVGKGSSEGFQALQAPNSATGPSSAPAETGGASKAAAPGALFEEKPQSANDTWRKLHSDPLLLIRQREQEALARIKSNPVQMAMIRKSVDAEKKHKENGDKKDKRGKKEHKMKHHYRRSKHDKHSSKGHSDSEDSTEVNEEMRKRDYPTYERHSEHKSKHDKHSGRAHLDSEDANEMGGKRKRDYPRQEVAFKEMEGRRHRDHRSYEEAKKEVDGRRHRDHQTHEEASIEVEGRRQRDCQKYENSSLEMEGRRQRYHQTHEEANIEVEGRMQRDRQKYENSSMEMEGRRRRDHRAHEEASKVVEGRRHRDHRIHEVSNEMEGKRQRNPPAFDHDVPHPLKGRHRSRVHSDLGNTFHDKEETGSNVQMPSDHRYTGPSPGRISESKRSGYNHRQEAPKLSAEEREARLREMQMNAELHEEQRWKRLKKASEVDAQEANKDRPSLNGSNFLDAAQKSIYGTEKGGRSTVEESVRRRTYYLQGGTEANESNAFRR